MGGEHAVIPLARANDAGSSPHGRGTYILEHGKGVQDRVIPAWAGNIKSYEAVATNLSGHPRMGGEHGRLMIAEISGYGSSPHGRGTSGGRRQAVARRRVIPAWAGNMKCWSVKRELATGHPRMGGEHRNEVQNAVYSAGSSPHGRGTSGERVAQTKVNRVIPAWAGNILTSCCAKSPAAGHPRMGGEHLQPAQLHFSSAGSSPHGRGT